MGPRRFNNLSYGFVSHMKRAKENREYVAHGRMLLCLRIVAPNTILMSKLLKFSK
jgi:hypothetical protein